MSMFKQATKEKLKARIALDGPAGSGKTYTALRIAQGLAGPGGRIAVIDTEYKSASKYVGESPDGEPFQFETCELVHYSPSTYASAIKEAGKAGFDVLVIDSLSHAWEGTGGALDTVDRKKGQAGGAFTAWKDVTPMHRAMVEAILSSPCHVVATMRTKMHYDVEETEINGRKKMVVSKIGTKPIQREGMEYEFDVVADLDTQHILTVSKSRCPALDGMKVDRPGAAFVRPLVDWLNAGVEPASKPEPDPEPEPEPKEQRPARRGGVQVGGEEPSSPYEQSEDGPCGEDIAGQIKAAAKEAGLPPAKLKEILAGHGANKVAGLPIRYAEKLLAKLRARASKANSPF